MKDNLVIIHGGGPTAVLNCSLYGAIREAQQSGAVEHVYGAVGGTGGLLRENLLDFGTVPEEELERLPRTPATAIGTSRDALEAEDYARMADILAEKHIRYVLMNGGNGTMDACGKLAAACRGRGISVMGIPKTMDNDIAVTDHCPGFGSAAKYAAVSALELAFDASALPIHVVVMELMGRNAGWITAASALFAGQMPCEHLVYLPETDFDKEQFLSAVKEKWAKGRGLLVTVSEGIHYADGSPVADSGIVDGFGHKIPGGAAQTLSDMIMQETGLKSRSEKPGLLGRVSVALMSEVDQREAQEAGAAAVRAAVEGKTGYMVGFQTTREPEYRTATCLIPLEQVANAEKKFPLEWIGEDGASIRPAFQDYCLPLLGGYDSRFAYLR